MNNNIKLNENTYWIGKVDDRDVPFHRLVLTKGTTYNSYLLKTKKPTVIDTVDISFGREYVENLKTLIDPMEIEYIVINHSEPDHSGGLGSLAAQAKNATIVCTEPAEYELKEMYKLHKRNFLIVKDGDKLDIGGKTLRFFETPYLHTEETMITYCEEDKILYPCDIFSTHIANYEYFNDLAKEDIDEDFSVYYSLIMHPHRTYVQKMINKIKDIDIDIIAPSHGYILRKDAKKYIQMYDVLSRNTDLGKKALVLYSTMTSNTKKFAGKIKEYLENLDIATDIMDTSKVSKEEAIEAIKDADAIFLGSSTRYGDMIGNIEEVLKELKNIDLDGKVGVAFGSYGWSGESIEIIQDYLKATNMKVLSTSDLIKSTGRIDIEFPIRVRFSLNNEQEEKRVERSIEYVSSILLKNK
ncbi:FprA family A-type flavoprotein [Clostridium intestinale]|uniref:Flavorubredoxin n=1 Tax=Clostridium intestinale DSM 6191 TaxID=1121320 RepID=A0A1M5Z851_9CLOT|nr:FprA family A-type flavoprotein [Clostridium intestinale]SHI20427.1 Flavorubredoxin [Clostridium intestinale DSM 6191]